MKCKKPQNFIYKWPLAILWKTRAWNRLVDGIVLRTYREVWVASTQRIELPVHGKRKKVEIFQLKCASWASGLSKV